MVEAGLVPCIVGSWGYFLPAMGQEKPHWRNLVARYGPARGLVPAGEYHLPTYSTRARRLPAARGDAGGSLDRNGPRICARSTPTTTCSPSTRPAPIPSMRPECRWRRDVNMLQTGHGSYASLQPSVAMLAECWPRPADARLDRRGATRGSWARSRQEVQRFLFWASITLGACGPPTAPGNLGMNSPTERHDGYTGSWGDVYWQDAMHMPGSAQVGLGRKFLERYPWWRLEPRQEPALPAGRLSAYATGIPGAVAIYYRPVGAIRRQVDGHCPGRPWLCACQGDGGAGRPLRAFYLSTRAMAPRSTWAP